MIRQTKIIIFLIFSLFLFHTAEQSFLLFEQTNHYALHSPPGNKGDLEHPISSDIHSIAEDVLISTSLFFPNGGSKAITLSMAIRDRLFVPILFKHWEPPK